jgi:hypothetical protein
MEASVPTRWETIVKDVADLPVHPNLIDYAEARARFDWDSERRTLAGLPGGHLNMAHEAVDRHAEGDRGQHDALRFVRADGTTRSLTYAELATATDRFASMLRSIGVRRGERVFSLLGRMPALYTAALGTLKHGAVFCPLFSAFGPEPVRQRLELGSAVVLVTTRALYLKKVAGLREHLSSLRHVLLVDADGMPEPDTLDLSAHPVLIFEHGSLYNVAGELPEHAGPVDIDRAQIRRPGADISLITYGGTLPTTMEAAAVLASDAIDAEVLDLRSLRPIDDDAIRATVAKTHRAVVIDEGWRSGSLSAEISARLLESAFYDLDAPIARVCSAEVPVPYAKQLERAALPSVERVVTAVREAVGAHV